MVILNGNQYSLCLIDTNVLSEMLKNPKREFKNYLELFSPGEYIPCTSLFTILEIRKDTKVYDSFLNYFSVFPFIILKSYEQLLQEEINLYPNPESINPILLGYSQLGIKSSEEMTAKEKLEYLFNTKEFHDGEKKWNNEKQCILEGMLSLVENHPPKNGKYSKRTIIDFIWMASAQQIGMRVPSFAKKILDNEKPIEINSFPSVKMMTYTVFYKFYPDNRKPLESDVFDILITPASPYVDVVLTEKHLAEIFRKTKKLDNFIEKLRVLTLKDIR